MLKVSVSTANRYIRNCTNLSRSERIAQSNKRRAHAPIHVTEEMNQVILGSLLGDGCVFYKNSNCVFAETHSTVQREYAQYKYQLLKKDLNIKLEEQKGYVSHIDGRAILENGRIVMTSETNVAFNKYRREWYPSGKKEVPESVYELGALGLAIWFMDDGTSNKSSFYLSTQGFNHESQLILVDMMKKNFNIECHVHKQKNTEILYICAKDKQRFINMIRPYICSSMIYKIIGHDKQGELLES